MRGALASEIYAVDLVRYTQNYAKAFRNFACFPTYCEYIHVGTGFGHLVTVWDSA